MASVLKVDTITGVTTAGSISVTGEGNSTTTNLQQGLTKAWLSCENEGTLSIHGSINISSISDDATGRIGITINNNFANNDYSISGIAGGNSNSDRNLALGDDANLTAGGFVVDIKNSSGTAADVPYASSTIHGDLA